MKRFLLIFAFLLVAVLSATAQKGMSIDELFGGDYQNRKNVTEVVVRGTQVKAYNLTLFRSITVADDPALAQKMETLVKADGRKATDREEGLRGGRLYYAFYSFRKGDGTYSYIFYRNNLLRKNAKPETTVVYMEGHATLAELKKMFVKK